MNDEEDLPEGVCEMTTKIDYLQTGDVVVWADAETGHIRVRRVIGPVYAL